MIGTWNMIFWWIASLNLAWDLYTAAACKQKLTKHRINEHLVFISTPSLHFTLVLRSVIPHTVTYVRLVAALYCEEWLYRFGIPSYSEDCLPLVPGYEKIQQYDLTLTWNSVISVNHRYVWNLSTSCHIRLVSSKWGQMGRRRVHRLSCFIPMAIQV